MDNIVDLEPQLLYKFATRPAQAPAPRTRVLAASDLRLIRILRRGGHGTVYLAEDTVTESYLAMKAIDKGGLRMREYPVVFEEQDVTRRLTATGNPWFAPLEGSFHDTDNFYLLTVRPVRNTGGADANLKAAILSSWRPDARDPAMRKVACRASAYLVCRVG